MVGNLVLESVPKPSVSLYMSLSVFVQASSITSQCHTSNSHISAWPPDDGGFPRSQAHPDWYKRALAAEFRSRLKEAPLASLAMFSCSSPANWKNRTSTSESINDGACFGSLAASQVLRSLCGCQAPLRFGYPVLLAMSTAKYRVPVPRTTAISQSASVGNHQLPESY